MIIIHNDNIVVVLVGVIKVELKIFTNTLQKADLAYMKELLAQLGFQIGYLKLHCFLKL